MIFLTVGTWRNGYDRLVQAVDELVGRGELDEPVFAQIGYGHYKPKYIEAIEFCSPEAFKEHIRNSRLIISHAGVGSIASVIEQNKPIIVMPRRSSLGEVDNEHQFATARNLEQEGKILVAYEEDQLMGKIRAAKDFIPVPSEGGRELKLRVEDYFDALLQEKKSHIGWRHKFWPYYILRREREDLKEDLHTIMEYFQTRGISLDGIVFIPNAGIYLSELFREEYTESWPIYFITVQRASTVANPSPLKEFIFRHKWVSDLMRHVEVLLRLIKVSLKMAHKREVQQEINFDVEGKNLLVIDDSVDTGTTLRLIKKDLLERGAQVVLTACISNHLRPQKVPVDYAVYRYALLRTPNSRDFKAS